MEDLKFRNLNADEIEIRVTDTATKGTCSLLLYQNARVAMNILDETVGKFGWSNRYQEIKGNLYCSIGIYDKNIGDWVWKEDTGIESSFDATKGEASDAFKRSAVKWGIGRELYTSPRIKIKCSDNYYINDRMVMTFKVTEIEYEDKNIVKLTVADKFNNVVFQWKLGDFSGVKEQKGTTTPQPSYKSKITPKNSQILKEFCAAKKGEENVDKKDLVNFYNFYLPKTDKWKGEFKVGELYKRWEKTKNN